jgi:1-acyl-sn-glycerol-3-phosphate acyltransferase
MSEQERLTPIKAQVYRDPRPPEYFDRFHERARTQEPNWVYDAVRTATMLYALGCFRARCISAEKVPPSGPVILAPNHFSFMDHFFLGIWIRRKVRFMAKSQLFTKPMQWIYSPGGVFPVRRGARDEEAFITADTILAHGGCVAMYCEGGRSRTGRLAQEAKPGIGRLALETGAPVVPVAIHGSSKVRNWKHLQFPKVTVQFGDAFRFEQVDAPTREQQQATANEIFDAIKVLYAGLEAHGRSGVVARVREERRAARRTAKRTAAA